MLKARNHALLLLNKANNDLIAAKTTLLTGQAFDTICFHSQQAVEKCLKAVLALHDINYPWTHDIRELVELVRPIHPALAQREVDLIALVPFAVMIRYSGIDTPMKPKHAGH